MSQTGSRAVGADAPLSDEELAVALQTANLPSLLAALAFQTGDASVIPSTVRPLPAAEAPASAQGGLTESDLAYGRELALGALTRIRDGAYREPAEDSAVRVKRSMEFLTGGVSGDYLPLLSFELGIPLEEEVPRRSRAELAPDRHFTVAVIGAGMSGLAASHELRSAGIEHVVLEKHADVGGVWLENDYPGCRLDSNNFTYSYSFAQKDDWHSEFSTQPEVQRYFADVATDLGLRANIRFETEVLSAEWIDDAAVWRLICSGADGRTTTLEVESIVSAVGQLNRPSYPDIPGRPTFAGESWHTAQWNHTVSLEGKRVAVIGSGASGYQVVPAIADEVGELFVFQRSAPYMLPTPQYHAELSAGQQWLFTHVPDYHRWFRFYTFWTAVEGKHAFSVVDPEWDHDISVSEANEELRQELVAQMRAQYVNRPDLAEHIEPKYPPYGKRMLRDNGVWSRALQLEHTELVTDPIAAITPTGIVTRDGVERAVDVIIYATGFEARDLLAPMEIIGRGGVNLRETWNHDPQAYLGITVPHFPNLFLLYGPNTNLVVNGSQVLMVECSIHYILECYRLLFEKDAAAIDCRADVLHDYIETIDRGNEKRTWGAPGVTNWYKNASGRVTQNWPFSILKYWQMTREPDQHAYDFS